MANVEINDLTDKTTPAGTDEIEIQETGGGSSKKASIVNLATNYLATLFSSLISGLAGKTTPVDTDEMLIQETGGGDEKKVTLTNLVSNYLDGKFLSTTRTTTSTPSDTDLFITVNSGGGDEEVTLANMRANYLDNFYGKNIASLSAESNPAGADELLLSTTSSGQRSLTLQTLWDQFISGEQTAEENIPINSLSTLATAVDFTADLIAYYDDSDGTVEKIVAQNFLAAVLASSATVKTGTSTTQAIPVNTLDEHNHAVKAWAFVNYTTGVPAIDKEAGFAGTLTDDGVGDVNIDLAEAMDSTDFAVLATLRDVTGSDTDTLANIEGRIQSASVIRIQIREYDDSANAQQSIDVDFSVAVMGVSA